MTERKVDLSKVYRSSDDYLNRELAKVEEGERAQRRLVLDITDMLTGPTSGHNAEYLAKCLVNNRDPKEVCERLKEAADRYLNEKVNKAARERMAALLAFNSFEQKEAASKNPNLRENTKEALEKNREVAVAFGIEDAYNAACSTLNV